jgi:uncharacterized protein (TIGR03083 family)
MSGEVALAWASEPASGHYVRDSGGGTLVARSVEAMFDEEFEASFDLASRLTEDQWNVPSLCPGWAVRDVVVHLAYHTHRSGLKEVLPNLEKTTAMMVERENASSRDGLLRWLSSRPAPTERKSRGTLAELVIHQQDIRRPLGLPRDYPEDALRSSLDLCTTRSGNIFVIDRRFRLGRGLRLVTTDLEWTLGKGPEVRGTAEDILMAIAGRRAVLLDLDGDGVRVIADRLRAQPTPSGNA